MVRGNVTFGDVFENRIGAEYLNLDMPFLLNYFSAPTYKFRLRWKCANEREQIMLQCRLEALENEQGAVRRALPPRSEDQLTSNYTHNFVFVLPIF